MQPRPLSFKSSLSPSSSLSPAATDGPVPISSSSSTRNSKLDHIIQNFYTKTAQTIIQARCQSKTRGKLNKWFNIATEDSEAVREEVKYWRGLAIHADQEAPPPMIIDVFLDTSKIHTSQALMVLDDNLRRNRVDLGSSSTDAIQRIMLETWVLNLTHPLPEYAVDLPSLYKRSIVFFRSLHSLVRLLPGHHLFRHVVKQPATDLKLGYQFRSYAIRRHDEISLEGTILEGDARHPLQTYSFSDIVTPLGTFKLQVQYRRNCEFQLEDVERDFSTRFVDMDEYYFTPTVTKYDQPRSRPVSMYGDSRPYTEKFAQPIASTSASSRFSYTGDNPLRRTRQSISSSPLKGAGADPIISTSTSSVTRGAPIPAISPFKSPSLSSSPQADQLFGGKAHATDRPNKPSESHSSSLSRKIEFSSSFDKYKGSPSRIESGTAMTRRWSRQSETSSIHQAFDQDFEDSDLEEFYRFVRTKPELKLFQQRPPALDTAIMQPPPSNSYGSSPTSADTSISGSIYKSKKALNHFQMLRDTHTNLSESMTASMLGLGWHTSPPSSSAAAAGHPAATGSNTTEGISPSSSTSTSRSYQPTIPSPLHHHHMPGSTSPSSTSPPRSTPPPRTSSERRKSGLLIPSSASLAHRHAISVVPMAPLQPQLRASAILPTHPMTMTASPPMSLPTAASHPPSAIQPRQLARSPPSLSYGPPPAPTTAALAHGLGSSALPPASTMVVLATSSATPLLPPTGRAVLATTPSATVTPDPTTSASCSRLSIGPTLSQQQTSVLSTGSTRGADSGLDAPTGRTSLMEDDDSLVFKMSELGMEPSSSQEVANPTPAAGTIFKTRRMMVNALRRTSSSDNIRAAAEDDLAADDKDRHSPSASSCKSEPTTFDPDRPRPSFGGW
ncbi:hypothetical protein DM01DRAFT_1369979 [Hesseltinella vesiculosa]|uniref:Autophagy-related protein 13 n=1 Tax=Hesseltinella vesiculosa TaxID=101127 RepID=A0A1X2GVK8_9FUNG|nr:hypothetical protein DM01DRAFT_1369979 [Hesseltinella vesiculosa]